MPLEWPDDCRCPPINVGLETVWSSRAWDEDCPVHGVGTDYFRNLTTLPYGYQGERYTTREEWIALRSEEFRQWEKENEEQDGESRGS